MKTKYPTLKEKIANEIEKQKEIEAMDITETILKKVMEDIREQKIYAIDIKNLYFYPVSNNYFCRSFSVGYAYTTTVFEHDNVIEGTSTVYLHAIGKHGDCSRDVIFSILDSLKERLENEGLAIEPYLENGFCVEI